MNRKTFSLTDEKSLYIERLYYIQDSYRKLLSILSRELCQTSSDKYRDMIDSYSKLYQTAEIEFSCALDTFFHELLGVFPRYYSFDFYKQEVVCEW